MQKDEEGFLIHHSLACEQALRSALATEREKETLTLTQNLSLLFPPVRQSARRAGSQANRSRSKREKGNVNGIIFLSNRFPWVLKALRVPIPTGLLLCSSSDVTCFMPAESPLIREARRGLAPKCTHL